MTDPISDMLSQIRNAILATKQEVVLPYSQMKFSVAKILEKEGLIKKLEVLEPIKNAPSAKKENNQFKKIKIVLKYDENKRPAISNLKRISKPGQKIYADKDSLPRVLDGLGLAIISTSRGLMTEREARQKKIGGEVICEIW